MHKGAAKLTEQLRQEVSTRFGANAAYQALAPGRVNLIGDHTDYSGGLCLPMAVDMYTAAIAAKGDEDQRALRLHSLSQGDALFELDTLPPRYGDWRDYIGGVIAEYQSLGFTIPSLNVVIGGSLPLGAGLSSSASLELCIASLIERASERTLEAEQRALLCQRAEHSYPGVPCGILDQFAVSFAREGSAMLLDCRAQKIEFVRLPKNTTIAIVDSKVSHALNDGGYAARRREVQDAELVLGKSLRDCASSDIESLDADVLRRRAKHVVTENARVQKIASLFAEGALRQAGDLMYESHTSLASDFEVSCSELDLLVQTARDAGALGARMTGGGFGGSMVCLVEGDSSARQSFAARVEKTFCDAFGHAAALHWVIPAGGAQAWSIQ